jgi:hypothetical protein
LRRASLFMLAAFAFFTLSSCKNVFSEFSNKNTDDALIYDAVQLADARNWTAAIAKIGEMTVAGQAKRSTKLLLASLYAGRCGLDLLQFASDIETGLSNGTTLMPVLSAAMKGAAITDADDCETGETIIQSIAALPANRSADENVTLAFIEFAKIGAVLVSSGVDVDGDGVIDTDHANTCALTTVPGGQTVSPAQRIGAGIMNAYGSLKASSSTIGGSAITAMDTMCATLDAAYGAGFCTQYLPSNFGAGEDDAMATLALSNEIGFNLCGGTIFSSGSCTCP